MSEEPQNRANRKLVTTLVLIVIGAFGFGYLLVPLYDAFCQLVGIERGVTQQARVSEAPDLDRTVTVEFILSTNDGGWKFAKKKLEMKVHPGKMYQTGFTAENTRSVPVTGQAIFSTAPAEAGKYVRKTECFCFSPQPFAAGEKRKLPMVFMLDPSLPEYIETVTLAYTMYSVNNSQ